MGRPVGPPESGEPRLMQQLRAGLDFLPGRPCTPQKPRTDLTPNSSSGSTAHQRVPLPPNYCWETWLLALQWPCRAGDKRGWGPGPPGRHQGGVCSLVGVRGRAAPWRPCTALGPSQVGCPGQHLWEGGPACFPLEPPYRLMKGPTKDSGNTGLAQGGPLT